MTTQTGAALALEFDLAPADRREAIAAGLAEDVRRENGRIATGFLGTPLVLFALSRHGYLDEAYLMLLRREAPSWLYQVDRGATTVWERWDAILPDGSIHSGAMDALPSEEADREEGSMLSFNHYAYGAMIDWVYRTVGGLAPDPTDPGYRTVHVAPRPAEGLDQASASIQTRSGRLAIDWRVDDGVFEATLEVPFGARAVLDLPVTDESMVTVERRRRHPPSSATARTSSASPRRRSPTRAPPSSPEGGIHLESQNRRPNTSQSPQRSAMTNPTARVVVDAPYRSDTVASAEPIIGWITETRFPRLAAGARRARARARRRHRVAHRRRAHVDAGRVAVRAARASR